GLSPVVLVLNLDVNQFLHQLACRLPRHLFFLLDGKGRFLHHPDKERIGTTIDDDHLFAYLPRAAWNAPDQNAVADDLALTGGVQGPALSSRNLQGSLLPGVDYAYARKGLAADGEQLAALDAELQCLRQEDPSLRCNRVHRFSRFVE